MQTVVDAMVILTSLHGLLETRFYLSIKPRFLFFSTPLKEIPHLVKFNENQVMQVHIDMHGV